MNDDLTFYIVIGAGIVSAINAALTYALYRKFMSIYGDDDHLDI